MAQLWDHERDLGEKFPVNACPGGELNPASNPLLAQNLGRWAQVYFTTPPEKREKAVTELLHELEHPPVGNSPPQGASLQSHDGQGSGEKSSNEKVTPPPSTLSPACSQANDPELDRLRSVAIHDQPKDRGYRLGRVVLTGVAIFVGSVAYLLWAAYARPVEHSRQAVAIENSNAMSAQPVASSMGPGLKTASIGTLPALDTDGSNLSHTPGAQELRVAQQYLSPRNGPRNPAEGAVWLWKAVAKRNPAAPAMLADLYVHGDGVPQSCEQARLLLAAAVDRRIPGSAGKLHKIESEGCP